MHVRLVLSAVGLITLTGHDGTQMVAVHTTANGMGSVVFMANKKGAYNFYCAITGHKEAGMVGTLTVE